jgi:hypothetical protein
MTTKTVARWWGDAIRLASVSAQGQLRGKGFRDRLVVMSFDGGSGKLQGKQAPGSELAAAAAAHVIPRIDKLLGRAGITARRGSAQNSQSVEGRRCSCCVAASKVARSTTAAHRGWTLFVWVDSLEANDYATHDALGSRYDEAQGQVSGFLACGAKASV